MFFRNMDGLFQANDREDLLTKQQPFFEEMSLDAWAEMEMAEETTGVDRASWIAVDIAEQRAEFLRGLKDVVPDSTGRLG